MNGPCSGHSEASWPSQVCCTWQSGQLEHPHASSPYTHHKHNQGVPICHFRPEFECDGAVGLLSLCSSFPPPMVQTLTEGLMQAMGFVHLF